MKYLILLLLFTSCGSYIHRLELERAKELCFTNDGIQYIRKFTNFNGITVVCENGATFSTF